MRACLRAATVASTTALVPMGRGVEPLIERGKALMTAGAGTNHEMRVPDKIARSIILPEYYADEQANTYPAFAWLRENMPIGQAQLDEYDPLWLITKFDDIMAVEREPVLFNATSNDAILRTRASDEFIRSMTGGARLLDAIAFMDPPEHTRIKTATANWFRPKNVQRFSDHIRAIAREDVERLLSSDDELDWVKDFAHYYPLRAIMTLFGLPMEQLPIMLRLTQEVFGTDDPDEKRDDVEIGPDQAGRQFQTVVNEFFSYFNEYTDDRRANPRDDLMSWLANVKIDGEFLPESFVNASYLQVATAGHDTTSATLSGAALALARHPEQLQKVKDDPALIGNLVNESVRWTTPVKHFMRTASEDTTLRGVSIKRGDRVMLNYPSGNRDEDYFANADSFDIQRSPNNHLGFGYGAHMCIGLHIAKLEMQILWEELLPRITGIEVVGPPVHLKSNFVAGHKSLPVRIHKA